ncbi:MAG TPA: MazG nucleotide pyrophosphohydrolase domain-containing protein [Candidatus Nanoarchaeia archaeon]|nr:MazG nucleotide pyrophosphohydrolase domain-containing protein [Candidatus Nanoarchaeia archaeon]
MNDVLFRELVDSIQKCRKFCPWTRSQTVDTFARELHGEAAEVLNAVDKKDIANLREELGDVVWDALMTAHIAEEHGLFTKEEIIQDVVAKMKRRKPYAFEGRTVTIEEAGKMWVDVKKKEKLLNVKNNSSSHG